MKKNNLILYSIMALVVVAVLSIFVGSFEFKGSYENQYELQWYYYDSNNVKKNIDFPSKVKTKTGEEVTVYADIPIDLTDVSTLFFRSVYQTVEIKINDEVLYVYNETVDEKFGMSMPRKLNVVNLPSDIQGKTVSITTTCPYEKYSGYFSNVDLGSSTQIINSVYSKYSFGFILSLLLIFMNLCFILINFLFYKSKISSPYLFFMFLSGLFVGLWLLGDSKLITLFYSNKFSNEIIYIGLMCFTLLFSVFLKKVFKNTFKKFINTMLIISLLNLIVQIILQHLLIADFVYKMPINLIIIFILFVSYFIYCLRNIIEYKRTNRVYFTTTIEFIVVIILLLLSAANIIMQSLSNINLNPYIGLAYFFLIITIYVKTVVQVLRSAVSSTVYKAKLKETQNYLMQSQMKPHFIFNTLGAIRTLIMSSPKVAYDMTTNFSKYLRANISTIEPGEKISFAQELDHIRAYVAIEQERFKNRINVIYDIQSDNFYIPPLSVEPLVENAIKHGVCKKVKGGTVKIMSKEYEDKHVIIVEDDGVGFNTEILQTDDNNKSVGLKYIILRLKQLSDADFEIESEIGKGTKAIITVRK